MKDNFWKGLGIGIALASAVMILYAIAWTRGHTCGVYSMQAEAVEKRHGYWGVFSNGVGERFRWKD